MRRRILRCALCLAFALALSGSVHALNISTHRLVNIAAADYPMFDRYLREFLGFARGCSSLLPRRGEAFTAEEWLDDGGEREDDGGPLTGRFFNHFHNPLKPWSEAGLHAIGHNPSSVQWMQQPNQAPGGSWAWADARQLYLKALTDPSPRTREEAAAELFRALGQIMHLVVDASVPEHTRDDPHPFGGVISHVVKRRRAGNYEYWVSDDHQSAFVASLLSHPIGFDGSILQIPPPPGERVATVPIARLIDTDMYGSGPAPADPNVTLGGAIGLAEFASANFFSEDTLPRAVAVSPPGGADPQSPASAEGHRCARIFCKARGPGPGDRGRAGRMHHRALRGPMGRKHEPTVSLRGRGCVEGNREPHAAAGSRVRARRARLLLPRPVPRRHPHRGSGCRSHPHLQRVR